ncbi:hypothetical protein ACFC26_09600 [Kitasatospora purpeofusca]
MTDDDDRYEDFRWAALDRGYDPDQVSLGRSVEDLPDIDTYQPQEAP